MQLLKQKVVASVLLTEATETQNNWHQTFGLELNAMKANRAAHNKKAKDKNLLISEQDQHKKDADLLTPSITALDKQKKKKKAEFDIMKKYINIQKSILPKQL